LNQEFEQYYKKYSPMIFRRCKFLLGDGELAMEAMQDTFVNFIKSYDPSKEPFFSSWFYTAATNVSLNILRTKKRHPETKDEKIIYAAFKVEDSVSKFQIKQIFGNYGRKAGEKSLIIAIYYFVDEMTHEEIADALAVSVSTVRNHLEKFRNNAKFMEEIHGK